MTFPFETPLIGGGDIFSICAVIFSLAFLGVWLETTPFGRKTSGVVWVLIVGTLLSNFKFIPFSSPVYDFIGGNIVPLSIPLLLFKADIRLIIRDSGPVLLAFAIASVGVLGGAYLGYFLLDLGEIGPKVAGVYTGGWIGGTVNFVAVAKAVEFTPEQFAIAIGASSGVSIACLALLLALPNLPGIRLLVPSKIIEQTKLKKREIVADEETTPFLLHHLAGALAVSFIICAVSNQIAIAYSFEQYSILIVTVLAILVANIFPGMFRKMKGDFQLGIFAMYIFFASIGAGTDAVKFMEAAPILLVYGLLIMIVHFIVVFVGARIFKIDLAPALIGSAAAFVGAAPAAAVATAHGWKDLVTPGIMCGILGYVIATFIGIAVSGSLGGLG